MSLQARTLRDGAIIDYDLPQDAHGTVTLEVLDSTGKLLRKYTSDDPVAPTSQQLRTELIPAIGRFIAALCRKLRPCIAGFGICAAPRHRHTL